MHLLSSTTGPVSYSEISRETGNPATTSTRKVFAKDLIAYANSVPIINIFKHYGVRVDEYNRKIICPFKSHKGGHENTPSFWYYPDTNSFCCYGCDKKGRAVSFVSEVEKCNSEKAAAHVLSLFANEVDEDLIIESSNPSERLEIMLKFSNSVFEFRQNYTDKHAIDFIEYMCWVYDNGNYYHKYDNEALRRLVEHCVEHIEIYNPQLTLTLEKSYLKLIHK